MTIGIASLALSAWNLTQILRNPAIGLLVDRAGDDLTEALNRHLARSTNAAEINARLTALLNENPRPWIAIEAVSDLAEAQGIPIDPALRQHLNTAHARDHGVLQTTGKCLACGWDAGTCEISATLLCRVPVDLTPVGDVAGVLRESGNYALGRDVDEIDLTLSAIGLGATVITPLTGGTSYSVKLGATAIKTARKLGRLSPSMSKLLRKTSQDAFDWDKIAKASPQDLPTALKEAVNPDALQPLARTTQALGELRTNTDALTAIYLMRGIDTAADAEKTAQIGATLGARTLGAFETVGKSRLFRATLKYSDEALAAFWSALAALASLGWLAGSLALNRLARRARRATRHQPGPLPR